MKGRKLIFLDFDGVINSHNGYVMRDYDGEALEAEYLMFEEHIEVLNWLIDKVPDAEIIISSTWRKYLKLKEMRDMMVEKGFKYPDVVTGVTPIVTHSHNSRGNEIQEWFAHHEKDEEKVDSFVIIDDANITEYKENRFMRIHPNYGLMHYDAIVCQKILLNDMDEKGRLNVPVILF